MDTPVFVADTESEKIGLAPVDQIVFLFVERFHGTDKRRCLARKTAKELVPAENGDGTVPPAFIFRIAERCQKIALTVKGEQRTDLCFDGVFPYVPLRDGVAGESLFEREDTLAAMRAESARHLRDFPLRRTGEDETAKCLFTKRRQDKFGKINVHRRLFRPLRSLSFYRN